MSKKSKSKKSTAELLAKHEREFNSPKEQLRMIAELVQHDPASNGLSLFDAVAGKLIHLEVHGAIHASTATMQQPVIDDLREKHRASGLQIVGLQAQIDRLKLLLAQALESRNSAERHGINTQLDAVTKMAVLAANQTA